VATEPWIWLLVGVAAVVAVAGGLALARRRVDRALTPTRLGPAWSPPSDGSEAGVGEDLDPGADDRVDPLVAATGVDAVVVADVLNAWDEYLDVIGVLSLPATHPYRVYDPYDPPVAERKADGHAAPDPARVARDIARRRPDVDEIDARAVLAALNDVD